jgi:hypothetical protein
MAEGFPSGATRVKPLLGGKLGLAPLAAAAHVAQRDVFEDGTQHHDHSKGSNNKGGHER